MDGELLLPLVSAIFAIIGIAIGYVLNHALTLRERKITRDFEIREKGRDFYHQTYGLVAVLSDLIASVLNERDSDKATVLTEKGYDSLPKEDIVKRYKKEYKKYSKFWYESRDKGLEVFLTKRFASSLGKFWAYAGHFYSSNNWENDVENMKGLEGVSLGFLHDMDTLLGLNEKESRIPKWLNPKKWRMILRSEKT